MKPLWRNWIAHQTSNLGVVGSNPTWGALVLRDRGYGLTARRRIPDPKIGGSNPSSLIFYGSEGYWSRGMIPALGAGGREFESRMAPF